jgi:transcriptional regulator with XRE-family HTH domain
MKPKQASAARKPGQGRSIKRGKSGPNLGKLRAGYGLSRPVLARALGITEATLGEWEEGVGHPGANGLAKVRRVRTILKRAAGTMRASYLPTWLEKPCDACAELGAATPLDLLERGDYEAVEGLIYYLGSGVPF